MTGYVSTRYYRAPEIMLTWRKYNEKVDIWSAGCIFAELLLGEPLFPGKNHINQFCVITDLLGNPPDEVIKNITSENVSAILLKLYRTHEHGFADYLSFPADIELHQFTPKAKPHANITAHPQGQRRGYVWPTLQDNKILTKSAAALIDRMLQFDPQVRISATEALESPYLAPYHDPNDEPVATETFDWAFLEADLPADIWKTIMSVLRVYIDASMDILLTILGTARFCHSTQKRTKLGRAGR
jgi:p38 MAP kinase